MDIPRAYQMAAADLEQETLNFLLVALFINCSTQLQLIRGKQKLSIKCYYGQFGIGKYEQSVPRIYLLAGADDAH